MKYSIAFKLKTDLSTKMVTDLFQELYDSSGIAGQFEIRSDAGNVRNIHFLREAGDDFEYIRKHIPVGSEENVLNIIQAAADQLAAELLERDAPSPSLTPIIKSIVSDIKLGDIAMSGAGELEDFMARNQPEQDEVKLRDLVYTVTVSVADHGKCNPLDIGEGLQIGINSVINDGSLIRGNDNTAILKNVTTHFDHEGEDLIKAALKAAVECLDSIKATHPEVISENLPDGWTMASLREKVTPLNDLETSTFSK